MSAYEYFAIGAVILFLVVFASLFIAFCIETVDLDEAEHEAVARMHRRIAEEQEERRQMVEWSQM